MTVNLSRPARWLYRCRLHDLDRRSGSPKRSPSPRLPATLPGSLGKRVYNYLAKVAAVREPPHPLTVRPGRPGSLGAQFTKPQWIPVSLECLRSKQVPSGQKTAGRDRNGWQGGWQSTLHGFWLLDRPCETSTWQSCHAVSAVRLPSCPSPPSSNTRQPVCASSYSEFTFTSPAVVRRQAAGHRHTGRSGEGRGVGPVELSGLGRRANELSARSGRGRAHPHGTEPDGGGLRAQ